MILKTGKILLISLGLLLASSIAAQVVNVTGVVTDETNQTLPGVNIVVKGTDKGTVTDVNGYYDISGNKGDILVFTFIGFKKEEIRIESERMDVSMSMDAVNLDEVVAIGYGNVRKKDITSSITSIEGTELAKTPMRGNFTESLQGLAAGVQVFNTEGSPGSTPTVIIRGATSINGDPNPMYVVDGIPIGKNVNQINSEDI